MSERIVILKLNEDRDEYTMTKQIPKEMRDECFKRVGSEFLKVQGKSTQDVIRGLNAEQEKIFLPTMLGVAPDALDFPKAAKDFWADYFITPTREGLRLNIAMEIRKDKNGNEVSVPVNPEDFMKYMFAKQSSKVASSPEDLENKSFFDFTLEDLSVVKDKEVSLFLDQERATIIYSRLASKFEESQDKIDWILEMTKEDGSFYDPDMESTEKRMLLKKLSDKRPKRMIELAEDKDLQDKAFLSKALAYLEITKEGNDYFYLSENIGTEERGALAWLRKAEKSGSVAQIKARLDEKTKNKKQ